MHIMLMALGVLNANDTVSGGFEETIARFA